jgi:hypothetical protein
VLLSYAIMRQHRFDSIAAMIESSEREATALCGNGEGQDEINRRLFVTFAAGFPPPAPLTHCPSEAGVVLRGRSA